MENVIYLHQDNTALVNIAKKLANYCEQLSNDCNNMTRLYYADHHGIMITYPYYVMNDSTYEHDQCTDKKILYDPRIKPVSMQLIFVAYKSATNIAICTYMLDFN